MIKLKETVIVEGRYDKIKLSSIIDGRILDVGGFRIFKDKAMQKTIKELAAKNGIVILTDSDRAGFKIRNFIKSIIGEIVGMKVINAYIPQLYGKEKRKDDFSKEGYLGVEGLTEEVIIGALEKFGAEIKYTKSKYNKNIYSGESKNRRLRIDLQGENGITKLDLYSDGLTGAENSAKKRKRLFKELNLPSYISTNALIGILNQLFTKEEYKEFIKKLNEN